MGRMDLEARHAMRKNKLALVLLTTLLMLFVVGCKKKQPVAPPPPPPPPPPPVVEKAPAAVINSFTAEPSTIVRGEASTLKWSVSDATAVTIEGVGSVQSTGSRQVYPTQTTTYRMTAKGAGGDAVAAVTVAVTAPPPPPPPPPPAAKATLEERIAREVQDAYFDFDKSEIREDARATLQRDADALKSILNEFPSAVISVEGHCDERGSAEYNMALGDRRATAAREFLIQLGVPGERLKPISYGKERPVCTESDETCWQKNRRAHFVGVQ
jgi:peptidoglycan-associated lipoprotein